MIEIRKSPKADSRSAKETQPSVNELQKDTESHISDVTQALNFLADLIKARGPEHDHTKIENMNDFHAALTGGGIKASNWYHKHITEERHHLKAYVHEDITLVDVIEHVADCTMAGLARSGEVYDVDLPDEVLQLAVKNTVQLLIKNTEVVDANTDLLDQNVDEGSE